jgi:hypothetical protein
MAFTADYEVLIDRLDDELRLAPHPAADLFAKIIGSICTRIPLLGKTGKTDPIGRMIEAGAWADAALAVVALELPLWKLRRLVYESGEWVCSLSRQPSLPFELDDVVGGRHEKLPLAILRAFIEARHRNDTVEPGSSGVPQLRLDPAVAMCRDNFV